MYEGLPVQTVYLRTPFLPPAQRSLKQDQIGPSSHKHDYDAGVLLGNWVEERSAAMMKFTKVPLDNATTYGTLHARTRNPGRPTPTGPVEVDRTLLFSHGRDLDAAMYQTTNELYYSAAPRYQSSMNGTTGSEPRRGFVDKKRDQWSTTEQRYATTKGSSIDSAAGAVLENPATYIAPKAPPNKWGTSVRELNLPQRNLGLRGPVPMNVSPLRRR
jgi:hypothetical protein